MAPKKLPSPRSSGSADLPSDMDGTYVYRAFCRCGDLLYIGVAENIFLRIAGHRRDKSSWEPKMVRLEWDIYRTRTEALRVEAHLIRTLGPLFNRQGAVPHPRPRPLPWPRAFSEAELDAAAIAAYRGTSFLDWAFGQVAA